jgi:hypothetical protein
MALIELHPQLTQTNKILERIAKALERALLEQYGVRMGHCSEPAPDPSPDVEPSVAYHTDEDTLKSELEELRGLREEDV